MASSHIAKVTVGGTTGRRIAPSVYGRCTTAAATVAKTVNLVNDAETTETWASDDLFHGLTVYVQFQYANTASSPTLNVNSSGAKPIYRYGTTVPGTSATSSWNAGAIIAFTYDTTVKSTGCWLMHNFLNSTYSPASLGIGYGTCSTSTTTAEKAVTLSNYNLTTNGIIAVKFTNGLGSGSITLNVNSKGAKPMKFKGSNYTGGNTPPWPIMAGDTALFFYDGSSYNFLTVDRVATVYDAKSTETASASEVAVIFPNSSRILTGAFQYTFTSAQYVDVEVTLPALYSSGSTNYRVFFTPSSMSSATQALVPIPELRTKATGSFTVRVHKNLNSTATGEGWIAWMAIGH